MVSRRTFLKVGFASACLLAATRTLDRSVFAQEGKPGSLDLKALANKDAELVAALAIGVLKGALPDDPVARQVAINEVVEAFDRTFAGLSPAVQKELQELLSLLTFSLTRRLLAGVPMRWADATEADVSDFLERWRSSRFALLQQGYQALARVMIACWYGNPLSWQKIGYGGPPHARELGLQ